MDQVVRKARMLLLFLQNGPGEVFHHDSFQRRVETNRGGELHSLEEVKQRSYPRVIVIAVQTVEIVTQREVSNDVYSEEIDPVKHVDHATRGRPFIIRHLGFQPVYQLASVSLQHGSLIEKSLPRKRWR